MKQNERWKEFNLIIDTLDLDIKEKGLLLIIFRYINHKTGYANPSRVLLKQLTGITDNRTLDNIIKSLIEKGFLCRESGKGVRSKYFIKVGGEITPSTEITPSGEITPIPDVKITPTVGGEITPQKEKEKKTKENIYSDLVKNYPGKKVKAVRDKKLPKILKEYSLEEIERCINRYSEECMGKEKRFILNESTFWNGRYIDYLDENYQEDNKDIEQANNVQEVSIEELMGGRV